MGAVGVFKLKFPIAPFTLGQQHSALWEFRLPVKALALSARGFDKPFCNLDDKDKGPQMRCQKYASPPGPVQWSSGQLETQSGTKCTAAVWRSSQTAPHFAQPKFPKGPFSLAQPDSEGGEAIWSFVVTQVYRGQGVTKSGSFGAKTQLSAEKSFCERHDTGIKVVPRLYSFF